MSGKKDIFKNLSVKKTAAIVIGCLVIIYIAFSLYFTNHFYFGTKINGESVSGKTIEQAEELFGRSSKEYSLTLIDRRDNKYTISADDIDLKLKSGNEIEKIKNQQNAFSWPISIWTDKSYTAELVEFNQEKLEKKYNSFECFKKEYIIEPKSAYPEYVRTTNSYVIRKEVNGNKLKKDELLKGVINAINSETPEINLDEAGYYEKPKNTSDDKNLAKAVEELNKKVKMKVTYDFEDRKEVLGGYELSKMLKCDSEGDYKVSIDRDVMIEYLRGLSREYSTYGDARPFTTASGKEITIFGGSYGWLIDKEKEADELTKVIEKGKSVTREPVYSQKALYRTKDDIGKTYVEISLSGQYLWYFRDGKLVTSFPVVTGNVSKGHGTPGGIYPLNYKERDTYLSGQGYNSHVNYWMPFNSNIGLHDATWRSSFGGSIYKSNGSHGCVNCPYSGAATIYQTIEPGTPIILY